jgi:hypothetical protein
MKDSPSKSLAKLQSEFEALRENMNEQKRQVGYLN